jgi:hypothetical protein
MISIWTDRRQGVVRYQWVTRADSPDGQSAHARYAQFARRANVPQLILPPNQPQHRRVPLPQEGRFAIVTDVGSGMRWTRQRQARDGNRRAGLTGL